MNATEDTGRLSSEITKSEYDIDFMTRLRVPNVQGPLAGRTSVDGALRSERTWGMEGEGTLAHKERKFLTGGSERLLLRGSNTVISNESNQPVRTLNTEHQA